MNEYEAVRGQAPMGVLFLIVGILYLIFSIIGIAQYVMQAIALNDLGKRRNVKSSWLAWIPVTGFSTWVTGCMANILLSAVHRSSARSPIKDSSCGCPFTYEQHRESKSKSGSAKRRRQSSTRASLLKYRSKQPRLPQRQGRPL